MNSSSILEVGGGLGIIADAAKAARNFAASSVLVTVTDSVPTTPKETQASEWSRLLELVELAALDELCEGGESVGIEQLTRLQKLCSQSFDFRRALGLAKTDSDFLKESLRFACVAVLGQRVEDWRRWVTEFDLWPSKVTATEFNWASQLFHSTASAFLSLVRKKDWDDLRQVARFVDELRSQQARHEAAYLEAKNGIRQAAAFELITFYHFAKAVETAGVFTGKGQPGDAIDEVSLQMRHAIEAADLGGIVEWAVLLRWLHAALRRLMQSTLWHQLAAYNHKVTDFKKLLTSEMNQRPLFELLPPQQDAVAQVMNASMRALVVQMPTSSGKTLLAQFRILQAKINYPKAWIAYLVPTRALVNQITSRLRRAFRDMVRIELASPAEEIDIFEEELFSGDKFDVLVTTPEKLDLIVRGGKVDLETQPLSLVVFDEAQHIGDSSRGLRAELLLANINSKSPNTAFLLLTPFIKNATDVARWLEANPQRSAEAKPTLAADWTPNDVLVAMAWPEGKAREWTIQMESLHTSRSTIELTESVELEPIKTREVPKSRMSGVGDVAAETARCLGERGATLIMLSKPEYTWKVATQLADIRPSFSSSDRRQLVRKFVAAEYGSDFPLCSLLDRRVGVHHGGLSDEVRFLVEWLMEKDELDYLVATSTLAQGINFDLSNVILGGLSVQNGAVMRRMTYGEFWNVAGRAGRVQQDPLGVVVIAAPERKQRADVREFVGTKLTELVSAIESLLADVEKQGWELDLSRLAYSDEKWSAFVQYLSHCYRQIGELSGFIRETEKILGRTYAYQRLAKTSPIRAKKLMEAVKAYGQKLSKFPAITLAMVDSTGFSPSSIVELSKAKTDFPHQFSEWSPSRLFRSDGGITAIIGRLMQLNETRMKTPHGVDHQILASLVQKWVAGESLASLAALVPQGERDNVEHLTKVASLVFQSIRRSTSWGLSASQRVADIDVTKLTPEEQRVFQSLPSMVYYGCQTVDGVLMRSQGVPRGICETLGKTYRAQVRQSDASEMTAARTWLTQLPDSVWDKAVPSSGELSGRDFRSVWKIINGIET